MKPAQTAVLSISFLLLVLVAPVALRGQAGSTASKSAEVSAFGGYMPLITDYGPHSLKGIMAGADFTVFPRFPVAPSFEVRGTEGFGKDLTEKTILFGLRIQREVGQRFHPYVDALIGVGQVVFHPDPQPAYGTDSSRVLSYGAGINIDVSHHLSLKIDAQRQSWNFGENNPGVATDGDFTLTPTLGSIGVTYTLPFRMWNHRADFR